MSVRSFAIGLLALMCGVAAASGVAEFMSQQNNAKTEATVPVVVARVDVPRGTSITSEQLQTRQFPKDLAPAGAIVNVDDAIERAALVPLEQGEPVLEGKLANKGAGGLAALVPVGMRAFTIHTPTVASGVAGFVLPGNRIDILLTVTDRSLRSSGGAATAMLLQDIEILAVDQALDAPADNRVDLKLLKSVTLLVTPGQAARVSLAQNKGTLQLALRNPDDTKSTDTLPVSLSDLNFPQLLPEPVDVVAPPEAPTIDATPTIAEDPEPPRRRLFFIRTLRGTHPSSVRIDTSQGDAAGLVASNPLED